MDWHEIFGTSGIAIAEVVLRGTLTYIAIFVMLRVLRRESGSFSISDLIVVVFVADAAQNAMAGSYTSVPEGIVLVATIVVWSYILDLLSYRSTWLRNLLQPSAVVLVKDGLPLRQNLRRNLLTMDELQAQLRENGLTNLSDVKVATLEADGNISVVPLDPERDGRGRGDREGAHRAVDRGGGDSA